MFNSYLLRAGYIGATKRDENKLKAYYNLDGTNLAKDSSRFIHRGCTACRLVSLSHFFMGLNGCLVQKLHACRGESEDKARKSAHML